MLRLKNTMPPATTDDGYGTYGCLDGTDVDSIVIPCGSLNTWLADSYWRQFADKYVEDCSMGINGTQAALPAVYAQNGRIIVEGADGETVHIFDITGRSVRNEALHTGVYIVKVDDHPARKIVVVE